MAEEVAVEAIGVEKSFGDLQVLTELDLRVGWGRVFSLLGPNGAGKTTTVRILSTLSRADAGRILVGGFDVVRDRHRVRRTISLTGQFPSVDGLQTGEENLRMIARLQGFSRTAARRRAHDLLERFDLTVAGRKRVDAYSGGMRRRLDLAASLVGNPRVIFLDEPTTGLDVRSRQAMWEVIGDLARDGATVLLTTQYLEEADRLSDRVAVLDGGVVVAEGTPGELKEGIGDHRLDLTLTDPSAFNWVANSLGERAVKIDPDLLILGVGTDGTASNVRAILDELDPDRSRVRTISLHSATLDDVFLALTDRARDPKEKETVDVR